MKNKLARNALYTLMVLIGLMTGSVSAVALNTSTMFSMNENGQTYGYFIPADDPEQQQMPDLVAAMGIDGTMGYVNVADLYVNLPNNPQEAIEYMQKIEAEAQIATANNSEYVRTIPLYDSDGTTVIGQFGIGSNQGIDNHETE